VCIAAIAKRFTAGRLRCRKALYSAENVELLDGATLMFSLKTTPRVSAPIAGTRLFAELARDRNARLEWLSVAGRRFQPTLHINCAEAVRPVLDDRPHYRTRPGRLWVAMTC